MTYSEINACVMTDQGVDLPWQEVTFIAKTGEMGLSRSDYWQGRLLTVEHLRAFFSTARTVNEN